MRTPIIIETDLGLDDVVSLAIVFQSSSLEVAAVIANEGGAAPMTATEQLGGLLNFFNRGDVPLYRAMEESTAAAPECRLRAQAIIGGALPDTATADPIAFTPRAYTIDDQRSTVLALGPLTQLTAALEAEPETAGGISRIIVAGDPERNDSWNLAWDPDAVVRVRETGIPIVFVRPGPHGAKPGGWSPTNIPRLPAPPPLERRWWNGCWSQPTPATTISTISPVSTTSSSCSTLMPVVF